MGFATAVTVSLRKYANFAGRAPRSEFWYFFLFILLAGSAAAILEVVIFPDLPTDKAGPIMGALKLALLVPTYAVSVRRLHDVDRSGWWVLLHFTGIGAIVLIVWFCMRGTDGANRFGDPPLPISDASQEAPGTRRGSRWAIAAAVVAGLVIGFLIVLGTLTKIGVIPSTSVVAGEDLRERDRAFLIGQGIVEPDEEIELFYSAALWSIKTDGNILTDRRIISYWEEDGEFHVYDAYFDEIEWVKVEEQGGEWSDTVIAVMTLGGEEFRLLVSAEGKRDMEFLSRLRERLPKPEVPEGQRSYRT